MEVVTNTMNAGSMAVSALIEASVIRVAPDASVYDIAKVLTKDDIGVVVVGDGTDVMGVVSEPDITRAVAAQQELDLVRAADIAHTELIWCDATATVSEVAEEMMEKWVRHVLVESDGRLVGVVSARDLLGVYASGDADFD